MSKFSIDRIIATELKSKASVLRSRPKYRFEAVDSDGNRHLIRKAGNLTKGMVQMESVSDDIKDHFSFNLHAAGYVGTTVVNIFKPGNGIDVVPYEAQ